MFCVIACVLGEEAYFFTVAQMKKHAEGQIVSEEIDGTITLTATFRHMFYAGRCLKDVVDGGIEAVVLRI